MTNQGTVRHWVTHRDFGFIDSDDGQTVFLHANVCRRCGVVIPQAGDRVTFEIEQTDQGPKAVSIGYLLEKAA